MAASLGTAGTRTTFSAPYDVRWPADIFHPAGLHEFVTAMFLVHEAAHAIVGIELGQSMERIWVRRPDHPGAVEFSRFIAFGGWCAPDVVALIALAAAPAVTTSLRQVGEDDEHNINSVDEMCLNDRTLVAEHARTPVPDLQAHVAGMVDANYDRVIALATRLGQCRGELTGPVAA